jgi:diguanylate cyclase (GGDEF)-like protein
MPALSEPMQIFTGMYVVSLLFALASFVLIADNCTVDRKARMVFLFCVVSVALITAFDWIAVTICPQRPELRLFHVLIMAFTFALAPVLPVAIAHAVFPERYVRWVVGVLVAQALLEVATIFGGFVFWVDGNNVYHRGPLYAAYMAAYCVSAVYLSLESIKAGRTYQSVNTVSIVVILLFLIVGVGIQVMNSNVRTTWLAVQLVLLLYFQFYTEMVLRTDALTRLLNRHSYEEFLDRPQLPCVVVIIDVNKFKHVNDTYGHAHGDVCLRTIASLIRRAFGAAGLCFRTGGDEFTVMVTKRQDETETFVSKLNGLIEKARQTDDRLPTVSTGMARASGAGTSIHDAIRQADSNMYEAKRASR